MKERERESARQRTCVRREHIKGASSSLPLPDCCLYFLLFDYRVFRTPKVVMTMRSEGDKEGSLIELFPRLKLD